VDLAGITAIDVHTHVHRSVRSGPGEGADGDQDMGAYFGIGSMRHYTVPELAGYYRERNMACVAFTVDSVSATGAEPVPSSIEVAELAAEHADVIIPFGSVDPARGAAGVRLARHLADDLGVRGFKFHPAVQGFYPDDRMAYPLYEVIASRGLVALFHTSTSGLRCGR
jgi:uncharacterized protein